MKSKILTYILIIFSLGVFFSSCDKEDNSSAKNIEGHWIYTETKISIPSTDPALTEKVEQYIKQNITSAAVYISYEFKNDKTFYYYMNYAAPLKGRYTIEGKNYLSLDDSRGVKKMFYKDSLIYVQYSLRSEIANKLNIGEDKLKEVTITEIYERGLQPSSN